MTEVDSRKVDRVVGRLISEYGLDTDKDYMLLSEAIDDVIGKEDGEALQRFAKAFDLQGLDKTKIWRYYAEV